MSILYVLTVTGISLGWLPRSVSTSPTGGIRSRLVARQIEPGLAGIILSTHLDLTPIEQAIFGFCILFCILAVVQLGYTFVALVNRRHPASDYRGRVPFLGLIFFSLLWVLTSFILAAVINSQDAVSTIFLPFGVFNVANFAEIVSPVFWYAGLVFLLFQRDAVGAFPGAPTRRGANTTAVVIRIVASVLLFIMLAAAIISEVIFSYTISTSDSPLINVANGMYYLYLAAYEVLTILIVVVSALLSKKKGSSPTLNRSDSNVIFAILTTICPLMVIRALFELAAEIVVAHPSYAFRVNIYGVNLATVLIEGTTQFIIFTAALLLGSPLGLTRRQY